MILSWGFGVRATGANGAEEAGCKEQSQVIMNCSRKITTLYLFVCLDDLGKILQEDITTKLATANLSHTNIDLKHL